MDKEIFQIRSRINVCTVTLRTAFKVGIICASYMCRWASVRGALPQPFVVFSVVTAALSARRKRLLAATITLLALRTLGEVLHGYVYGNEDWEDDYMFTDDDSIDSDKRPANRDREWDAGRQKDVDYE